MNLNNRGYMLVEVIISFTLAIVIMFFMTNATVSLKNKADDLYVTTKLEADQMAMTKEVMKDVNSMNLTKVDSRGKCLILGFKDQNGNELNKRMEFDDTHTFKYGQVELKNDSKGDYCNVSDNKYINLDTMYSKKLDDKLKFDVNGLAIDNRCFNGSKFESCSNNVSPGTKANLRITIHGKTAYDDNDYGLLLNFPYNYGDIEVMSSNNKLMSRVGKYSTDYLVYLLGSDRPNAVKYVRPDQIRTIILSVDEKIPSDDTKVWDVSSDNDGGVLAWISDPMSIDNDPAGNALNGSTSSKITSYIFHIRGTGTGLSKIIANENSTRLFGGYKNLRNIQGLDILDTSKVENMEDMFSGCNNLTALNLDNFDTGKVTSMSHMFYGLGSMVTLNLNKFNTSKVTNMVSMFDGCRSLVSLNLDSFDTGKVVDMSRMFSGLESIVTLNLDKFNTSKVTNMNSMFYNCKRLMSLKIDNFDTGKVTDMGFMFSGLESMVTLDLDKIAKYRTSEVINMRGMFNNCKSLTSLKIDNFDTGKVTDMSSMFSGLESMVTLDLDKIAKFRTLEVTDMGGMFSNCKSLTSLKIDNFDTGKVTSMNSMFSGLQSMATLDLARIKNFNTGKVTDMRDMFNNCNIRELNLSNFNTGSVKKIERMFKDCRNLRQIMGIENFNTGNVTNMTSMFYNCSSITSLKLKWDVGKVTSMQTMFAFMSSLYELEIPNFKPNKLSDIGGMFLMTTSLRKLDISGIDFSYIYNTDSMKGYLYTWCARVVQSGNTYVCADNHPDDGIFAHSIVNHIIVKDEKAKNFISERLKDNHTSINPTIEIKA